MLRQPSPSRASLSHPKLGVRHVIASFGLLLAAAVLVGCPSTQFFNEGAGQPVSQASGLAPPGSVGACRIRFFRRPPLVNPAYWENLRYCGPKTPRRYLRLGYKAYPVEESKRRMASLMESLKVGIQVKEGNARMLSMLRTVRHEAANDPRLAARVERSSGRTSTCDYTYLLNTTEKQYEKAGAASGGAPQACPVFAWDPKLKREQCLFDERIKEARWLTSAWGCLAFTGTVGEGESCYRLCAYDDYCTAQTSCAAPDFDLVLCALGICLPEKARGLM